MTTLTLTLDVDDNVAQSVTATPQQRQKTDLLVKQLLQRIAEARPADRLRQSMNHLSDEANKNGLKESALAELLAEIDRERA